MQSPYARLIASIVVLACAITSLTIEAQSPTPSGKCGGTVQIEVTESCTQCGAYKADYPKCPQTKAVSLGGSCSVNVCVKYIPPKANGTCVQNGQWYVPCCVPGNGQPAQGPGCLDRLSCCQGCKCGCSKWTKGTSASDGWGCFSPTSYDPAKVNVLGLADCECSKACTMDSKICKGTKAPGACEKLVCGTGSNSTNCSITVDCTQEGCCSKKPECAPHPSCSQKMCMGKCAIDFKTGKPNCSFECENGKCCCPNAGQDAQKCAAQCPGNPQCKDAGAANSGKVYPDVQFNSLLNQ